MSVQLDEARSAPPTFDAPTGGILLQFAVLTPLWAVVGLGAAGWLAGITYAVVMCALLRRAITSSGGHVWGPADTVTLARATLAGGVVALVADSFFGPTPVAALVTLAAAALLLDWVDGRVARRTGTTSRLGARFDMETDSILVLVLCVFVAGWLGWWVLAIGAFRYAFVAASWVAPWLRRPLPPCHWRKVVAATQGVVLVVVSAGVPPAPLAVLTVGSALALLCWSFGRDLGWLWRMRSPQGGTSPVLEHVLEGPADVVAPALPSHARG